MAALLCQLGGDGEAELLDRHASRAPEPGQREGPGVEHRLELRVGGTATRWESRWRLTCRSVAARPALPSTLLSTSVAFSSRRWLSAIWTFVLVIHSGVVTTTTWSAYSTAKVAIGAVTPVPRSSRMTS